MPGCRYSAILFNKNGSSALPRNTVKKSATCKLPPFFGFITGLLWWGLRKPNNPLMLKVLKQAAWLADDEPGVHILHYPVAKQATTSATCSIRGGGDVELKTRALDLGILLGCCLQGM